jgi:hypothetical protein
MKVRLTMSETRIGIIMHGEGRNKRGRRRFAARPVTPTSIHHNGVPA